MEIVRCVRLTEIDPVFFETSYYVAPEPLGDRAYGMLYSALRDTGYVALATVAMHGRDHVVLIRPGHRGLLAHTMFYVNEVKPASEYPAKTDVSTPNEVELARTFVAALAGPFAPEEFQDSHNKAIQELISEKMDRGEVARASPAPESDASGPAAPVTDIMDALRRSLELRKPAVAETKSAQPAKGGQSKRTTRRRA
jgi:DNA end-binding protein Ku